MKFSKTLSIMILTTLMAACAKPEHTSYTGGSGGGGGGQGEGDESGEPISFAAVSTVISTKCAGCHQPGGRLMDLSTYQAIMSRPGLIVAGSPEQSRLYTVIQQGIMPPRGALPAEQQALVGQWITDGALP